MIQDLTPRNKNNNKIVPALGMGISNCLRCQGLKSVCSVSPVKNLRTDLA